MSEEIKGYAVCLSRVDRENPVVLIETNKFEEAKTFWRKQYQEWTDSVSERRPFIIQSPVMSAFEPSLIKEIYIFPVREVRPEDLNPYEQKMRKDGFSSTFNQASTNGMEILDQGYKY